MRVGKSKWPALLVGVAAVVCLGSVPRIAAGAEAAAGKSDVLEIAAPRGSHVAIDGNEAAAQQEPTLDFRNGKEHAATIDTRFIDGSRKTERIHLRRDTHSAFFVRPDNATDPAIPPSARPPFPAYSASFSPDGRRILVGPGRTFRVWDASTGEQLPPLTWLGTVATPDGGLHLVADENGTGGLLEASTGKMVVTRATTREPHPTAISPDGRYAIIANEPGGHAASWEISAYVNAGVRPYGPNGKAPAEGASPKKVAPKFDSGGTNILVLAYSPDGAQIAAGLNNNTIVIWQAATAKVVHRLVIDTKISGGSDNPYGYIYQIAYSPDARRLLTISLNEAFLWDAATGKLLHQFQLAPGGTRSMLPSYAGFTPDGRGADRLAWCRWRRHRDGRRQGRRPVEH